MIFLVTLFIIVIVFNWLCDSMFDSYYIIKKTKIWNDPVLLFWWIFLPIGYILIAIMMFIPMYLDYREYLNAVNSISIMFIIWFFVVYWIYLLIETIKQKRIKNFKYNWLWAVKKAKVVSIGKMKANKSRWYKVDVYYFEAEDWGDIYYSNGYTKWVLSGVLISELKKIYAKYWYIFDDIQSQKEDVLRKINEEIVEIWYEIDGSWFISKILKGRKLWKLEADRKMVLDWYIPPYWQIWDNKVSVWDIVDVYLDPNNPERYWVDTDFLF